MTLEQPEGSSLPLGSSDEPGTQKQEGGGYRWFTTGDINGFFGLMFDNLTVLSFVYGILVFGFKFPADIVATKMFPGTAFGVLFGDMVYTWMAFRLAKKTGKTNVTAMPLGLDTPSSIGVALAVLGPAFLELKTTMPEHEAAMMTWYIGMATMINVGIIKLIFSFFGAWLQKVVPQAGLLGSLAGIGLILIGLVPMIDIFRLPVVGLFALGIVLYTLVANIRLPGNLPGVACAVLGGTGLFYLMSATGLGPAAHLPDLHPAFNLPTPTIDFIQGWKESLKYLPIAFPFAILTVIGGVNVTESARVGGDDYNTQSILVTEAMATIVAGLCGGVAQSTPYIGQPAYKAMGARSGYTVLTGLFIGLGGCLGFVSFIVEAIPRAVLAPILIFVALDIIVQAYQACPARHAPAVALAHLPTVARLLAIYLTTWFAAYPELLAQTLAKVDGPGLPDALVIVALGNGFIVTAMLWGGFLAELIDRRLLRSAFYLTILAILSLFGIIHSSNPNGNMYNPMDLSGAAQGVPYQFFAGYLFLAALLVALSFTRESKEAPPEDSGHGGHFG